MTHLQSRNSTSMYSACESKNKNSSATVKADHHSVEVNSDIDVKVNKYYFKGPMQNIPLLQQLSASTVLRVFSKLRSRHSANPKAQ